MRRKDKRNIFSKVEYILIEDVAERGEKILTEGRHYPRNENKVGRIETEDEMMMKQKRKGILPILFYIVRCTHIFNEINRTNLRNCLNETLFHLYAHSIVK